MFTWMYKRVGLFACIATCALCVYRTFRVYLAVWLTLLCFSSVTSNHSANRRSQTLCNDQFHIILYQIKLSCEVITHLLEELWAKITHENTNSRMIKRKGRAKEMRKFNFYQMLSNVETYYFVYCIALYYIAYIIIHWWKI